MRKTTDKVREAAMALGIALDTRHANCEAEGYNVQDHRPRSAETSAALKALSEKLGVTLNVRCSVWGGGHVETYDGWILDGQLDQAIEAHIDFQAPGMECDDDACEECGGPVMDDASPGVLVHGHGGEVDHERDANHVARRAQG